MKLLAVIAISIMLFAAGTTQGAVHDPWTALLKTHVEDGRVDYLGFKRDEDKLDGYLAALAAVSPRALNREERLAFYINAYNSYTVKLILTNFSKGRPVKSIKHIGGLFASPWSISFVDIGGETISLDTLEHKIIRPQFKDPRVHFAINCASKGCPPLMNEAYAGRSLDRQLEANTRSFLNHPDNTFVDKDRLYVTKIFSWFAEDFNHDIIGFLREYATGRLLLELDKAGSSLQVKYLDYDWSLNGSRP